MRCKLFIILALACILIAVLGAQGCQDQNWNECYTDTDCIKTQVTCCPCNMGGSEQCISKMLAPLYQEKLKSCPPEEERVCIALNNCKIKECLCVDGRCIEKK